MDVSLNHRQKAILEKVRLEGRVLVDDLALIHHTTPQTIRRDLQVLADTGEIMRFHGGASLLAGIEYTSFEARKNIASSQKEAIGRAVAAQIPNNTVLMLNVGTTTAAVARALKHHAGLKIITDNVNIANDLRTFSGVEVLVPGGTVRQSDGAILGAAAVEFINQFRADISVISSAAIDVEGSLLDFDLREAHVARAMIKHAKHTIIAADSSKFTNTAPVCIGHIREAETLITASDASTSTLALCKDNGVECVLAQ